MAKRMRPGGQSKTMRSSRESWGAFNYDKDLDFTMGEIGSHGVVLRSSFII